MLRGMRRLVKLGGARMGSHESISLRALSFCILWQVWVSMAWCFGRCGFVVCMFVLWETHIYASVVGVVDLYIYSYEVKGVSLRYSILFDRIRRIAGNPPLVRSSEISRPR